MQISKIQMELPFPKKIEMHLRNTPVILTISILSSNPSDRIQIRVKNASERDLTDDDQRIENFCWKNRNSKELLFPDGGSMSPSGWRLMGQEGVFQGWLETKRSFNVT